MGAADLIRSHKDVPVNVLFYRDLFAVPDSLGVSAARQKVIKCLKGLGITNIKEVGQERFVSKKDVEEKTAELFHSDNQSFVQNTTYKAKSKRAQNILSGKAQ